MPKDRESSREALLRRMRDSENRQSVGRSGFLKQNVDGVKLWTPDSKNTNIIDFVPYKAGNNDPFAEPGDPMYMFEAYYHGDVGMSEGGIMCLAATFPQGSRQGPCKCPICMDRARKLKQGASDEIIKALRPKRYPRTFYNIVCWNNREQENKGIQIFNTSFWLLEMFLRELAKKTNRGQTTKMETLIPFMDIDEGKSIAFKKEGDKDSTRFVGIRFEDREGYNLGDYIDEMGFKPFCLDEIVVIPTFEQVEQYYYGNDTDNQPTGEQASRRGRGRNSDPEEEPSSRGRGRNSDDDASSRGRGRNSDPEEEPSSRGRGRNSDPEPESRRGRSEQPPDDDPPPRRRAREEEPPDDDPPRRRRGGDVDDKPKSDCPSGYEFGADVDTKEECEKCNKWEACAKKGNELNKNKRAKDPEPPDDDPPPRRRRESQQENPPDDDPPPRRRRRGGDDD